MSSTAVSARPRALLLAVAIGHTTNDVFMAMGPVMLAFTGTAFFGANAAEIGLAISLRELISALSQPLFGLMVDRTGGRWLGALGVAWTAAFMIAAFIAALTSSNFGSVVLFACLAALGSGAFHPVGTVYSSGAQSGRAARNSSIFFLFGQVGLAAGPTIAGLLLGALTIKTAEGIQVAPLAAENGGLLALMWLVVLPALIAMPTFIPRREKTPPVTVPQAPAARKAASFAIGALLLFIVVIFFRSLAHIGTVNFIPILFQRRGWIVEDIGAITSLFWIASAVSGVVLGSFADRYDRRVVLMLGMWLSAPMLFLLPVVPDGLAPLIAIGAGAFGGASFPLSVVMAQSFVPQARGFASGLALGGIFAAGSLGGALMGLLADGRSGTDGFQGIGLPATFQVVAALALFGGLLTLLLPSRLSGRQVAVAPLEAVTEPSAQAAD